MTLKELKKEVDLQIAARGEESVIIPINPMTGDYMDPGAFYIGDDQEGNVVVVVGG